jgi:signal transduction histidine kinase/CheY-like chemotaxis protein/HPt (histidine-containing phosphotransfer) domain-containing protein
MRSLIKKIWTLIVSAQVVVVFFAFALMVVTSYFLISRIEHENLRKRVKEAISLTEANIKAELLEPETILAGIAETIRTMILRGDDAEMVLEYIKQINNYMQSNEKNRLIGINGFYGFFDVYGEIFITGEKTWIPPQGYLTQNRPWYIAAVDADGDIGVTQPYINLASEEVTITFARRIFNENNRPLGIVCLNIYIDRIRQRAIYTQFTEDGYGFLLSEDLVFLAHPEPLMLGIALRDLKTVIAAYDLELRQKGRLTERITTDYQGVKSIVFIEKLYNGWYMGLIMPRNQYYQSTRNLAMILITLGTILAAVLTAILLRISAARKMAEERLRVIFDATPLGVYIHKKDFCFIDCNESVINLFGLSGKQEYFDKFYQLIPEYQPDGSLSGGKMKEYIDKAFSEGYCRFEWIHQKLDGTPIPCDITAVRVNFNSDLAFAVYLRDLRELNQMMDEIQQRENLLNTVNSVANVLLSVNDEQSFEAALLRSFSIIGNYLDVDRIQIWRNMEIDGELNFVHRYEWLSEYGNDCVPIPIGMHFQYRSMPEWESLFLRGGYINAPVSRLSETEQVFLSPYEMKSIVIIPIFLERQPTADRIVLTSRKNFFWGLFSIDDCRRERNFSDEEIRILTSVGLMMSSAVNRNLHIAKLHEAEERIQVIFDATPLCVSIWDRNCNITDCNQETLKLFEVTSKKEYCQRFFEFSPEHQPDGIPSKKKINGLVKKAFNGNYCRFEWIHKKLNGEPVPCDITLVRVEYKDDFIVAGFARDLRELRTTIAQMNESKQSLSILENILNGIDALIYVTVPDTGEILFLNDRLIKHFNIESEYAGRFCYKVFMNKDEKCDFCPCFRLDKEPDNTIIWETHNPVTGRIYRCMDRYIEWYNGKIVHIQHAVDMTELITAKEMAEQSSRFKSQFLSRMSHEVRTPMNAILGITEILLQKKTLSADIQEALDNINNSGYLLLGIINDILDLSKIEAGKLELAPSIYDVPSLINDTVHLNVMLYDSKQIVFSLHVDENIPLTLFGDELRIKQILNNLISNAFKYTDEGEVSMSVTAEYPMLEDTSQVTLVIRVSDTGQGMTAEQVDRLFDEFTRFNTQTNSAVEGVGLGMNITRHLIRLMGGEIDIKSAPGRGSVFTVRLPQEITGAGVLGREMTENLKQFSVGNMPHIKKSPQIIREFMPYGRVLIVDDVETNLYVARGLISSYGISLETAISGYETIEKIKNGAIFDIIFLDHFMPKMDGIETAKIIRELGYTRPIIALTANALTGQEEMFLENGFDGFISKPIDIRQLNALLNSLIRDKYPTEVVEAARLQVVSRKKQTTGEERASDPELKAIFTREAEKAYTGIKEILSHSFRRSDDFRQYILNIHSMKSALANIGETGLSAAALELEQAGRDNNLAVMVSKTPDFLEWLHEVIEKTKPKDDDTDREESDNDLAYLVEKIPAIQKACEEYDEKTANSILAELGQKKWAHSVKELIDAVAMHLLHSDFDKAANLAKDFISLLRLENQEL